MDATPCYKKRLKNSKDNYTPIRILRYYIASLRNIRDICITKRNYIFTKYFLDINVVNLVRVIIRSTYYLQWWKMTWKSRWSLCFRRFINWLIKSHWLSYVWALQCYTSCIWFWYEIAKSHIRLLVQQKSTGKINKTHSS